MKNYLFRAKLFKTPCNGGWTFAPVPKKYSPHFKLAWGRTPVDATVNGKTWRTSVWTDSSGKVLLPVPKKIRGDKEDGDVVEVTLKYKL